MRRSPRFIAKSKAKSNTIAGFTLMEVLVSLAILVIVTGAVFEQVNSMQKKSASEATNVDLTQQSRDFVNQTVHDLHMAGYPGRKYVFGASTSNHGRQQAGKSFAYGNSDGRRRQQ